MTAQRAILAELDRQWDELQGVGSLAGGLNVPVTPPQVFADTIAPPFTQLATFAPAPLMATQPPSLLATPAPTPILPSNRANVLPEFAPPPMSLFWTATDQVQTPPLALAVVPPVDEAKAAAAAAATAAMGEQPMMSMLGLMQAEDSLTDDAGWMRMMMGLDGWESPAGPTEEPLQAEVTEDDDPDATEDERDMVDTPPKLKTPACIAPLPPLQHTIEDSADPTPPSSPLLALLTSQPTRRHRACKLQASPAPIPASGSPSRLHPCPHPGCTKSFTRPYNLKSHLVAHSAERRFACPACPRTFLRKHDMLRHARLHLGRKLVCGGCGKRFARADGLKRHLESEVRGTSCGAVKRWRAEVGLDGEGPKNSG
ncbi:hypothetical protein HDU96_004684 [Phlyctochytrium bullatum]|nr:hypothetical protein HDU96_004684 [Phlyctochytrium bullatum]